MQQEIPEAQQSQNKHQEKTQQNPKAYPKGRIGF